MFPCSTDIVIASALARTSALDIFNILQRRNSPPWFEYNRRYLSHPGKGKRNFMLGSTTGQAHRLTICDGTKER